MANNLIDAFAAALFTLASASKLGVADVSLLDTALTDTAVTLGSTGVSWGALVGAGTLAAAAIVNRPTWDAQTREQQALIAVTAALVATAPILPGITDALGSSIIVALGVVGVEAGGYWAVAQSS